MIRGEQDLWLEFIYKVKKEKRKAWEVLSPHLKKYIDADEETRVPTPLPKRIAKRIIEKKKTRTSS